MKKLPSKICFWLGFFLLSFSKLIDAAESPIEYLNLSVWSEYKKNNFEELSQEEKTEKLQRIFEDKLQFVQKHKIRRLIVKILDPISFEFFHPEKFDYTRDDNFYYWAKQLTQFVEVEALFDQGEFHLTPPKCSDKLCGYYEAFISHFKTLDKPFGSFNNLVEKLHWLTQINKIYRCQTHSFLVRGIVIDPQGTGDDSIYQNLINAFDQYRANASEFLPENVYRELRVGFLLKMDQKDLALANLARFPLSNDIKLENSRSCGLTLPSSFPSEGPYYPPPEWRKGNPQPMLDTVYLQLYDPRLIDCVYQCSSVLPSPSNDNTRAADILSNSLGRNFRGVPFVKGPGVITNKKGDVAVSGMYTFFKTGNSQTKEGQFVDGQLIEVRPPFVPTSIKKTISGSPSNNKELSLTSTFSIASDVVEAEYYHTPIPVIWTSPYITQFLAEHIYFVFSTEFEPKGGQYFGNWSLKNFLNFIMDLSQHTGFRYQPIFMHHNKSYIRAPNNLVLYDYSTLPNGKPYPDCNWGLGNQTY